MKKILTPEWVRRAPLHKVCFVVADEYCIDKKSISGSVFASLAKRLIDVEDQPGGPYKNSHGIVDIKTNMAISYLFICLGKPLLNVTKFLEDARTMNASPALRRQLDLYDRRVAVLNYSQCATDGIKEIDGYNTVRAELATFDEPLRSLALTFLEKIQKIDKNREIALLQTYFSQSLTLHHSNLPLLLLSEANIYCWMAYMIYDHLIDGESAMEYLPVANCAMRLSMNRYQSLFPAEHPFQQTIHRAFAGMDQANAWEMKHCRFKKSGDAIIISQLPSYGRRDFLARRSFGHVLGPLAIAHLTSASSAQINLLEKAFRHYLIARQLSDDIHDWWDDMHAGHSSPVVTYMLRTHRIKQGTYLIAPLAAKMKAIFWNNAMSAMNETIKMHAELSRDYFTKCGLVYSNGPVLDFVERLEEVARQSSQEKQRLQEFSLAYQHLG